MFIILFQVSFLQISITETVLRWTSIRRISAARRTHFGGECFFSISIWKEWNLDYWWSHMFCLLKIINLLTVTKSAGSSKLLWCETWDTRFPCFYLFLLFYLIPRRSFSSGFLSWNECSDYCVLLFFWRHHSPKTGNRVHFCPLTLHRIRQGTLPLAGCLHGAGYSLCSELRLVAVFVVSKIQTCHVIFKCFFFSTLFHSKFKSLFLCFKLIASKFRQWV